MGRSLTRTTRRLEKCLRDRLREASDLGQITNTVGEVLKLTQAVRRNNDELIEVPRHRRNFARAPQEPHFCRDDGAWFDFAITLHNEEIVAWSFELRFPDAWEDGPGWVRFDLNHPGHANEARGLRCHVHLGSDDDGMSIPYTAAGPEEVLEMVLTTLRKTGRTRARPPDKETFTHPR